MRSKDLGDALPTHLESPKTNRTYPKTPRLSARFNDVRRSKSRGLRGETHLSGGRQLKFAQMARLKQPNRALQCFFSRVLNLAQRIRAKCAVVNNCPKRHQLKIASTQLRIASYFGISFLNTKASKIQVGFSNGVIVWFKRKCNNVRGSEGGPHPARWRHTR